RVRNGKENKDHDRPNEKIKDRGLPFIPQHSPPADAIERDEKQEKAPGEKPREKDGYVVEQAPTAPDPAGCESHQAFLPKRIARETGISQAHQDEPRQGHEEKYGEALEPTQALQLSRCSTRDFKGNDS